MRLGWLDCAGWAEAAWLGWQAELAGQADMLDWAATNQGLMHSQQVGHCLEFCLTNPYYNALTTYMEQVSGVGLGSMALESGILLLSHVSQWDLERPETKLILVKRPGRPLDPTRPKPQGCKFPVLGVYGKRGQCWGQAPGQWGVAR